MNDRKLKHGQIQSSGEKILLTLWIGSLWTVGFLVAPIIFATLEDRQLAGMLAGKMFSLVSYIGLFCGFIIIFSEARFSGRLISNKRIWLLVLMLLIIIAGEFMIQPTMSDLKLLGLQSSPDISQQFNQLHQIATALYTLNCLFGMILIIFQWDSHAMKSHGSDR